MNMKRKNNGGFTLIELLVVVLIIGILAAIAIPQYFRIVEKSRAAGEVKSIMGDMRTSQSIYRPATGKFTTTLADLDIELPMNAAKSQVIGKFFTAALTAASGNTWTLKFTRNAGEAPTRYGNYTVTVVYDATTGKYTITPDGGKSAELFK